MMEAQKATVEPKYRFNISPSGGALGAEITGIDIATGLDEKALLTFRDAVLRHSVVVVRDQSLTPAQQVAFTYRLGERHAKDAFMPPNKAPFAPPGFPEILIVSNIEENGRNIGVNDAGFYWHTDNAYRNHPDMFVTLHALEVPIQNGVALGDTLFVSAAAAYEALDQSMRRRIGGLHVLHSFNHYLDKMAKDRPGSRPPIKDEAGKRAAEAVHPLVRIHPITGRKLLYACEMFSSRIEEIPEDESRSLLEELCTHIVSESFMYRQKWRKGDLVIWDNCNTQHHASFDYGTIPRRLHRCGTSESITPDTMPANRSLGTDHGHRVA